MGKVWLKGIIEGDGYIDDRHLEIYNSSTTILSTAVKILKTLVKTERIKVYIYRK